MLRTRSYGSVAITSVDRPALLDALRKRVRRLAERRPEIAEVMLYGSVARGDQTPESDIDLLFVVEDSAAPFLERADPYREAFADFPMDVRPLVYTRREISHAMAHDDPFLTAVLREARRLYPIPSSSEASAD